MHAFLEYVLRQLVDHPEEMIITRTEGHKKVIFSLRLRPSDAGKVIGKQGHTIQAIRNLLSAAAERTGDRVVLELIE